MPSPTSPKTIVITGGIVSGIGKGITAASLGRLLIDLGYKVMVVKADPYLNQDAGTMNPFRHGEVFVTDDGAETDLDLGHYERFMDVNLTQLSNFTGGAVYRTVMDQEREGEFLGRDIQVIPHITDEIKRRIYAAGTSDDPDFLIVELGGTIGDIEGAPFIEAVRQYYLENRHNTIFIHVVKMDYLYPSDEGKTKPIQHSIITMRGYGLQPDVVVVRCKRPITKDEREKLALFTGVHDTHIIPARDAQSLYDIPAQLEASGFSDAVLSSFGLQKPAKMTNTWERLYQNSQARQGTVKVGVVGKYIECDDAYLSVFEAIKHAGIYHQVFTEIVPINAEDSDIEKQMGGLDALIVPGGFGTRGIEGKIQAIRIAREKRIPYLGICLGLQTAVIEIARHLAKLPNATSTEFDPQTDTPVITILPDQLHIKKKGGTMRLGQYPAVLVKGTLAEAVYRQYRPDEIKKSTVLERHRHRYEVNPEYHQVLQNSGIIFSGLSPDGSLAEYIELPKSAHPYFIATQAHPELRSRPHRPHPLFAGLIAAAKLKK
ncbi:CTP synthase [Patescibacteria group bacterium]|nr:CTP synthase [Patescibacteria group bacterium]